MYFWCVHSGRIYGHCKLDRWPVHQQTQLCPSSVTGAATHIPTIHKDAVSVVFHRSCSLASPSLRCADVEKTEELHARPGREFLGRNHISWTSSNGSSSCNRASQVRLQTSRAFVFTAYSQTVLAHASAMRMAPVAPALHCASCCL